MLIFTLDEMFEFVNVLPDKLCVVLFVAALLAILIQHGIQGRSDVPCRPVQAVAQKLKAV